MLKPQGYVTIVGNLDSVRPTIERDTVTCGHCQMLVFVKPGTASTTYLIPQLQGPDIEEPGAMCRVCMRAVCLRCHDKGNCEVWEKKIEKMEARQRLFKAAGILTLLFALIVPTSAQEKPYAPYRSFSPIAPISKVPGKFEKIKKLAPLPARQVIAGSELSGVNTATTITSPTSSSTYDAGSASTLDVSGSVVSDASITSCVWVNDLGGSGAAIVSSKVWSISAIPLTVGSNAITVTCTNSGGVTGLDSFVVSRSGGSATNPISSDRISQIWSTTGATIDASRPICTTGPGASPLSPGVTAAQISAAIAGCDAHHAVILEAGTYNLTAGIVFEKSNVTLRGAGPNATFLKFTGYCNQTGQAGGICINPAFGIVNYNGNPMNICDWTAGYSRGTTVITIDDTDCTGSLADPNNLIVDRLVMLDQEDDNPLVPNDGWWISGGSQDGSGGPWGGVVCQTSGCGSGQTRTGRPQIYYTKVVSVVDNGSTRSITLADPLVHTNWDSAHNPQIWFQGYVDQMIGWGIEDISLDFSRIGPVTGGIYPVSTYGGWITNTRILTHAGGLQTNIAIWNNARLTIRGNYLYGKSGSTGNYGIAPFGASNLLVENNIGQCNETTITDNTVSSVFSYNFFINQCYVNGNWQQPGHSFHSVANAYILMEGNDSIMFEADQIHGPAYFLTGYRNYWRGWENGKHTFLINPFLNMAWSRYMNVVGNVLGTDGVQVRYESTSNSGDDTNCNLSIYALGWGNNCGPGGTGVNPPDDNRVLLSLLRWGNYDTFHDDIRWESSEVPSSDAYFPNTVPSDHLLPDSLYLSAKPSWYGSTDWPTIGPDITGGPEANVGGHVKYIPARTCFFSLPIDTNYATTYSITAATRAVDGSMPWKVTLTLDRTIVTNFTGTPTASTGTVSDATGWAIGDKMRIWHFVTGVGSQAFSVDLTSVVGNNIQWTPALPTAVTAGEEIFFFQDGDAMLLSSLSPAAYLGDRNGDILVYNVPKNLSSVSGNQITYGLLADPGAATITGATVTSPAIRQFTGCSYQP